MRDGRRRASFRAGVGHPDWPYGLCRLAFALVRRQSSGRLGLIKGQKCSEGHLELRAAFATSTTTEPLLEQPRAQGVAMPVMPVVCTMHQASDGMCLRHERERSGVAIREVHNGSRLRPLMARSCPSVKDAA